MNIVYGLRRNTEFKKFKCIRGRLVPASFLFEPSTHKRLL